MLATVAAPAVAAAAASGNLRVLLPRGDGTAPVPVSVTVVDVRDRTARRDVRVELGAPPVTFDLPPGIHELTVTVPGHAPVAARIAIDARWVEAVALVIPPVGPSRLDVVGRHRIGEGADFDARLLRDLPVADNLWSLVETAAPFVVVDRMDTGGLGLGRAGLLGARGESWGLTTVVVDGLPVRLPTQSGRLAFAGGLETVSAVSVSSGLAPIDVETPGVVLDLAMRRPGSSWQGEVDLSGTTPGMVGVNALPHAPSVGRMDGWRSGVLAAGGPVADRTGLFLSAASSRADFFERDQPWMSSATSSTVSAHVVANPSDRDQLRIIASRDRIEHPFDGRAQLADRQVDETGRFLRVQAAWDHVGRAGWARTLSLGMQHNRWHPDVAPGLQGGTVDRVLDGVVPAPPANRARAQWDARFDTSVAARTFGLASHWRGGATLRRTTATADVVLLPTVAESVAGLPARVWQPVAPGSSSHRALTEVGVFANDSVMLARTVTLDVGLRADIARGTTRGGGELAWNAVSPRLSVQWKPSIVTVFGGVGRYTGGHALSMLTFGDPGEATWDVRRWDDADADSRFVDGEAGVLVARAGRGAGVASIDPDLRTPRTTEWTVGGEIRPGAHSTIRGAIIIRRQRDLIGVVNDGVPASSYRLYHVPDINADEGSAADDQLLPIYERLPESFGRDALRLTNPAGDGVAYDGIELAYEFRSPRWFMLFGATAYRTVGWGGALGYNADENDQLVPGDRYWNPNALDDDAGRLFFDRAYVGKWVVAYRGPGDIRYAVVTRYQDGQPFTRFVVAPDHAAGPEIVQAYAMGRTRFTFTGTIDARIEKGFAVRGARASIRLDAFNLGNLANEVEEDVMSGASFRLSSAVQPPRTLRLGVRFEF